MILTEYDENETMQLFYQDGQEDGRIEGRIDTLISLVKDGLISASEAAKRASMLEADFKQLLE